MAAGILFCFAGSCAKNRLRPVFMVSLVILAVYTIAVSTLVIDGCNLVLNQIYALLEAKLGYIFPRYETAAASAWRTTLFLVLPAALLGLLAGVATVSRGPWAWLMTILAAASCAAAVYGICAVDMWTLLLCFGLALLWIRRISVKNSLPDAGRFMPAVIVQAGIILLLCAIPAVMLLGEKTQWAQENRAGVERKIHRMRYEEESPTLPEGDFTGLGDFAPSEEIAMELTMEKPQELYLRGYVGEVYTGAGWKDLEAESRAPYAKLFSWLHEREFYGQRQYAQISEILGAAKDENSIAVHLLQACTGWEYAPYELLTGAADSRKIGDQNLPAAGIRGQSEYELLAADYSAKNWEALFEKLSAAQKTGNPEVIKYLENENAYREFVYDSYLEITEPAEKAVSDMLIGLALPESGKVSFRDAQMVVRAYLSSVVSYNEEPQPISADTDFLTGFLQDTKEGYSVHYATAATLLFRYLGVPARYVEGWYIPEEASRAAQDGPLMIDKSYAHAWVEIYRDGIGFVPFEITPPYTDPMEQSNFSPQGGGGAEEPPPEEETEPLTPLHLLMMAALLILLLLLLFLIVIIVRRQIIRAKRKRMLTCSDTSLAVSNMTTWAVTLLKYFGITRSGGSLYTLQEKVGQALNAETSERYREVVELQQRVIFSRKGAEEKDREPPQKLLEEIERALSKRSGLMRRLRLKYIACVL